MRRHPNKTIPGPVGDEPTIEQRWTRWVAKRKENHTGPTYSFKGIDNSTYYAISDNPQSPYENFAGVGNAIHSPNRTVRKMILDSLRHWVTEMHVDGFRFDLASIFSRNSDGTINLTDPMLRKTGGQTTK